MLYVVRALLLTVVLAGCGAPDPIGSLSRTARVEGHVVDTNVAADAWLFLYPPGQGFPGPPAVPVYATAVSALRMGERDTHFVFAAVDPNPFRLWALLDLNGNFRADVDVLAQPGYGDRVAAGTGLNVQPGKTLDLGEVSIDQPFNQEPPAFRLEGDETDVPLDAPSNNTPATFTVVTFNDPSTGLNPRQLGFHLGLVDLNHDGRPDDVDGDGVPDLSLQFVLRWKPSAGQWRKSTSVVVPLLFDPSGFLQTLRGSLTEQVVVDRLALAVVPQAEELDASPGKPNILTPLGVPPRGDYELLALTTSGLFWRIPNGLSASPTQGVRFHFDRTQP